MAHHYVSDPNDNRTDCFHGITTIVFSIVVRVIEGPNSSFFQIELNCFRNELQKACHAAKGCQESSRHR